MGNCHGCYEDSRRSKKYKFNTDMDPSTKYQKQSLSDQSKSRPKSDTNGNRKSQPGTSAEIQKDVPTKEFVDQILTCISETSDDESESSEDNETEQNEGSGVMYDENETIQHVKNINIQIQDPHTQGPSLNVSMEIKPNLFRANTTTNWGMSDVENLQEDMAKELEALVLNHNQNSNSPTSIYNTPESIDVDNLSTFMPDQNELLIHKNSSNLIQTFSHDWDSDNMEMQEKEMTKYLKHLELEHQNSEKNRINLL